MSKRGLAGTREVLARRRWWRDRFLIARREVSFEVRGFRRGSAETCRRLERVGEVFLEGYALGLLEDAVERVSAGVEAAGPEYGGFAAEGAAMGAAVADAVTLSRRRLPAWLAASAARHTYLSHVGAGWALARVPFHRRSILGPLDPVHGWLAFDGLGFHDAYFFPERVLAGWRRPRRGYAAVAYEQGIGRALWFVGGGDPDWAADRIEGARPDRRPQLWAGLGLAVCYAGATEAHPIRRLVERAGAFEPDFAQGAAFAAAAWARSGEPPTHARAAVPIATGMSLADAAALVTAARDQLPPQVDQRVPRYERWRRGVRSALVRSRRGEGVAWAL